MIPCDTYMIPVWSEIQNIIKNMQKKWYKIIENYFL